MRSSVLDTTTLDRLAASLDGRLARPGDPGWDTARQAWQLAVDQQPAAVVHAASVRDVHAAVDATRTLDVRVAPQATADGRHPPSGRRARA